MCAQSQELSSLMSGSAASDDTRLPACKRARTEQCQSLMRGAGDSVAQPAMPGRSGSIETEPSDSGLSEGATFHGNSHLPGEPAQWTQVRRAVQDVAAEKPPSGSTCDDAGFLAGSSCLWRCQHGASVSWPAQGTVCSLHTCVGAPRLRGQRGEARRGAARVYHEQQQWS